MVINDLSNLEDIQENALIVVGGGSYVISNSTILGSGGLALTYVQLVNTGSTLIGSGYAFASSNYYAQSSVSSVVSSSS